MVPEPGGPGGPPEYLADQLTLFGPGRADYPHLLLLAPQCFSPSGITELLIEKIENLLIVAQYFVKKPNILRLF